MAELSKSEFLDVYWACLAQTTKFMEAYHKAEEFHIKTYGRRKYADYDSFRKSRDYKRKG